jgi:hypothetical protein
VNDNSIRYFPGVTPEIVNTPWAEVTVPLINELSGKLFKTTLTYGIGDVVASSLIVPDIVT